MRIDCQCLNSGTAQLAEDHIHLVPRRIDALYVVDKVFEGAVGHVDTIDAQQLIAHGEAGFDLAVGLSILGQIVDADALQVVVDGGKDAGVGEEGGNSRCRAIFARRRISGARSPGCWDGKFRSRSGLPGALRGPLLHHYATGGRQSGCCSQGRRDVEESWQYS